MTSMRTHQPDSGVNWTEDYIEALPREDNRVERKGSRADQWDDDKLREELAKQLSAFANTGGGNLLLGVSDTGTVDGGFRLIRKGRQTTKGWLEDIIPHVTEPEIVGWRVMDVQRSSDSSHIESGKAVFVIEIPDSERAPHQSAIDRKRQRNYTVDGAPRLVRSPIAPATWSMIDHSLTSLDSVVLGVDEPKTGAALLSERSLRILAAVGAKALRSKFTGGLRSGPATVPRQPPPKHRALGLRVREIATAPKEQRRAPKYKIPIR